MGECQRKTNAFAEAAKKEAAQKAARAAADKVSAAETAQKKEELAAVAESELEKATSEVGKAGMDAMPLVKVDSDKTPELQKKSVSCPGPSPLQLELDLKSELEIANTVMICQKDDWPDAAAEATSRCFLVLGYSGKRGPKKAHLSVLVEEQCRNLNSTGSIL